MGGRSVPVERDRLIVDLTNKDHKIEQQIAAVVGLTHQGVNKILARRTLEPMQPSTKSSKKHSRRRKLMDAQRPHRQFSGGS